jgi:hypothetical protein
MEKYKCPNCGSVHDLHVYALIAVRIHQPAGNHDVETEYVGGDHEWSDTSPAICDACEWRGDISEATNN